jgi:hypothetical protein
MSITASEARQRLFPLIEEVNDDQVAVQIFSKKGTAFLIARPLRADQHGPAPGHNRREWALRPRSVGVFLHLSPAPGT